MSFGVFSSVKHTTKWRLISSLWGLDYQKQRSNKIPPPPQPWLTWCWLHNTTFVSFPPPPPPLPQASHTLQTNAQHQRLRFSSAWIIVSAEQMTNMWPSAPQPVKRMHGVPLDLLLGWQSGTCSMVCKQASSCWRGYRLSHSVPF